MEYLLHQLQRLNHLMALDSQNTVFSTHKQKNQQKGKTNHINHKSTLRTSTTQCSDTTSNNNSDLFNLINILLRPNSSTTLWTNRFNRVHNRRTRNFTNYTRAINSNTLRAGRTSTVCSFSTIKLQHVRTAIK